MSCDFELKWSSAISIVDQCRLKQIANKRCQNKGNWILYKMVISDFQKKLDFNPQNFKKQVFFFWENCCKIQNFLSFQKTVLYVQDTHESSSHAKFQIPISIFDPQMAVISVKCGDVIKINHIFGPFIDIVYTKTNYTIGFLRWNWIRKMSYFQNFEFWKLTLFDPFWPDLQAGSEKWPISTLFRTWKFCSVKFMTINNKLF